VGIVTPTYQLIDVRNEDVLSYDSDGVARLYGTPDAEVRFARLIPGRMVAPHSRPDAEEDALVLSGRLTYLTGGGQEAILDRGGWAVAPPGEVHGYANRTPRPLTLLHFSPKARPPDRPSRARVFQPLGEPKPRLTVFETETSRGEWVALRPGENASLTGVRFSIAYCVDGRIMCLMKRDKLALESGEGVCLVHTSADLVGASGKSTVAVFATRF